MRVGKAKRAHVFLAAYRMGTAPWRVEDARERAGGAFAHPTEQPKSLSTELRSDHRERPRRVVEPGTAPVKHSGQRPLRDKSALCEPCPDFGLGIGKVEIDRA